VGPELQVKMKGSSGWASCQAGTAVCDSSAAVYEATAGAIAAEANPAGRASPATALPAHVRRSRDGINSLAAAPPPRPGAAPPRRHHPPRCRHRHARTECGENPGPDVHRRGGLRDSEHVDEPLRPAEGADEERGAKSEPPNR